MRPAVLLLLVAPAVLAQPPAKFASPAGKFAVTFPGKPVEESKPVQPGSQFLVHLARFEDADGVRQVMWTEISKKDATPGAILTGVSKFMAERNKTVKDEAAPFGPDRFPGRDITVDTPAGPRMRTLAVVAFGRLYQVSATGSNAFVAGPKADEFFKSFELTK